LNHQFDALNYFDQLKVSPPLFTDKIPDTLKVLQEKKAYFQKLQDDAVKDDDDKKKRKTEDAQNPENAEKKEDEEKPKEEEKLKEKTQSPKKKKEANPKSLDLANEKEFPKFGDA